MKINPKITFLQELFNLLWSKYRENVAHARTYEHIVKARGGLFRNDHVAFRTIATQSPWSGIAALARPFEALGYVTAGTYRFPDKKLSSVHLAPPEPRLPKVFISELRAWELSPRARRIISAAAAKSRSSLFDCDLTDLASSAALPPRKRRVLLKKMLTHFARPWPVPVKADVLSLERETQFGAWVLLHGHSVNHFTAAVDDVEEAAAALKAAGVPMKAEIEGKRGSKLRQSSTQAVVIPTRMRVGARTVGVPWTYAYFELAERPVIDGRRFEGFLGGQATNLFEMTRRA